MTKRFSKTFKSYVGIPSEYVLGSSKENPPSPCRIVKLENLSKSIVDAVMVPYLYDAMGWGEPIFEKSKHPFPAANTKFPRERVFIGDAHYILRTPHHISDEERERLNSFFNAMDVVFVMPKK